MTPRSKPPSCSACPIASHGSDFTQIDGTGSLGLMVVAEASGEAEARDQLPLRPYAPAGSLFERTLRRMGVDRNQLAITNCLRCRPRNNFLENAPWEYSALAHCRPNLEEAIARFRPRVLLALGNTALRELTGQTGEARTISHLRGYVLAPRDEHHRTADIKVVGTYHPAFIRRGAANLGGVFARDIARALRVARGADKAFTVDDPREAMRGYLTRPSLDEARSVYLRLRDNPQLPFSFDLETFESASLDEDARVGFQDTRIRLVQFAWAEGEAMALPWDGGYIELIVAILALPNLKVGHNIWGFDLKVLRAVEAREGLRLYPNGTLHDTLAMFHHWQPDLPAHLQYAASFTSFPFPWKHLADSDLEFYGCADVDSDLRLYHVLKATMERDQVWGSHESGTGYLGQVYDVRPILDGMEQRGVPIDDAERLRLDAEFAVTQESLERELQAEVPSEVLPIQPRRGKAPNYSYGYLRDPKDTAGLVRRQFKEPSLNEAGEPALVTVERWCRLEPFNPNSGLQLIAYMKAKGHKVPKDKHREDDHGDNPETTAAKELTRLAQRTGDTFYLKVIEYRGLTKMRGTYVEGFKPGADRRVHTTFTFDTAIAQIASKNPNVQNFPKLKPTPTLAKAMRRMIAADEGCVITEWDFKSCHVLTLGFLAGDANYIRLARLDMHSFVTGHILGLWHGPTIMHESDEELLARFRWLKSDPDRKRVRDDQAKHAILGIGNGLKAKGLFERYMENFPGGQKQAARFLTVIEELFPKVFAWQRSVQKLAHEQQWLRTQFGHIRRFYEVFRWDNRRGGWIGGDQAEMAISFWLSNIAFGHIRDRMKALAARGYDEKYGLFNNVHDSFMFHFRREHLEEHVADIYPVLVAPSKVLVDPVSAPQGLWIGVEAGVGRNWAEIEEIKLPAASTSAEATLVTV